MKKPLIPEDRKTENDLLNVHNPDKYENSLGNYIAANATKTTGKTDNKAVNSTQEANKTSVAQSNKSSQSNST